VFVVQAMSECANQFVEFFLASHVPAPMKGLQQNGLKCDQRCRLLPSYIRWELEQKLSEFVNQTKDCVHIARYFFLSEP